MASSSSASGYVKLFARRMTSIPPSYWASALAALPMLIWAQDSLVSFYRVHGSSMEPSLRHGDILVVRKSDGLWHESLRKLTVASDDGGEDAFVTTQKRMQQDIEQTHCHSNGRSWLIHKPPMPVLSDIIIYKDPSEYPWQYSVKRVVGLGHQVVMMPSNRYPPVSQYRMPDPRHATAGSGGAGDGDVSVPSSVPLRVASPSVPPYSMWVEGDNFANSKDSAQHGSLSKKLLVGIAEYRIWPPTRIGRLDGDSVDLRRDPKPYAYWP